MGVVTEKPRMRMPSIRDGSRPSVSNVTGLGSYGACGRVIGVGGACCGVRRASARASPERGRPPPRLRRGDRCCAVWEFKMFLAGAERDDSANWVVRRDADGHPVAGDHFDAKASHSTAQLGEHFVALVALHAIQSAAVNSHDGALHVNQIVLTQLLPSPNKDCATLGRSNQTRLWLSISTVLVPPLQPARQGRRSRFLSGT